MSDNLDIVAKNLISVRVIKMIVGIEHILDRLVRQGLNPLDQPPRRGWCHRSIDQHDVIIIYDDKRIAHDGHHAGTGSEVHPVGKFFEPGETLPTPSIGA